MNRLEFISLLEKRLSGIPKEDIIKTTEYYNEIISDKIDDGMSEEEAINSLGNIDEIIDLTLSEISIPKLVKEKFGLNRKIKTWEIVFLATTFYIWIPLLIAGVVAIFVTYVSIWSGVICLGAGTISAAATSLIAISGIIDVLTGNFGSGLVLIGLGLTSAGAAILLGIATYMLSKVMVVVCKKIILKIKSLLVKRGE